MKLIADLHTHTVASTHAYSTVHEMLTTARESGMQALATTDHGCSMPDAPHSWHFINLRSLPHWHNGFLLLKGVEANVTDERGTLDMDASILKSLDWVIASMHASCVGPMDATTAWLHVAENPLVDMLGHAEQKGIYPFDYDRVAKACTKHHTVVEMNASSRDTRPGNEENLRELALACKRNGTRVSVNSDAHSVYALGNQQHILDMLEDIDFPEELVINSDMALLLAELERHGKPMK